MNEKSIEEILAERQIKEFNESKFGQFFNNQKLKEQELTYLNNKALDIVNEEDLFEIMSLIPQPFITEENKNVDVLSLIYNNFLENTEIPLTLPIFSFLSFLSAFCVKNEITYTIPLSDEKSPLDTWITILAPSGSAKTFSNSQIKKVIPVGIDGKKVIESNFVKPNGPAKFIDSGSSGGEQSLANTGSIEQSDEAAKAAEEAKRAEEEAPAKAEADRKAAEEAAAKAEADRKAAEEAAAQAEAEKKAAEEEAARVEAERKAAEEAAKADAEEKARQEAAAAEAAAEAQAQAEAQAEDTNGYTVYITETGKKYHSGGCRHVKKSKIAIEINDARAQGYEPCSVCNP